MFSWMQLLKHWRWIVALVLLGTGVAYIRSAEQAKAELDQTRARAALADSLAMLRAAESQAYTDAIDSLKVEAQDADAKYRDLLNRPPRRVFIPVERTDSTTQDPVQVDTTSVWDIPEVKEALEMCDERVRTRDAIIEQQDKRHFIDQRTIAGLRIAVVPPPQPPPQVSPVRRVVTGALQGLAIGVVAQQATGEKGLIVSASLGALFGFFRH